MIGKKIEIYGAARAAMLAVAALLLTNCASSRVATAPAEQSYRPAPGSAIVVAVRGGETVSEIAQHYGVAEEDIVAMNGLRDRNQVLAGQRIYIPAYGSTQARLAARAPEQRNGARAGVQRISVNALGMPGAYAQRYPSDVIIPKPRPSDASRTVASATPGSFRDYLPSLAESLGLSPKTDSPFIWPVNGRVVSTFGKTTEGGRNDGINIAVPQGTPVRAAADGVVSYVGNELKGYGNLLLIRHDNGFVTAYAHADRIAVERGERVRRGDTVAYTGATGDVTQPQLHFEIRQGVKPVNPTAYLGATGTQANRLPRDPARS
jgi:murein DD-endopeptidase MepM/ murein hydrolase activator NlpD